MLVGMKWLFEKKMKNLKQDIKLIEYCSFAGKEGKYAYNHETFKDKSYSKIQIIHLEENEQQYFL